jgi:hypothetical protein
MAPRQRARFEKNISIDMDNSIDRDKRCRTIIGIASATVEQFQSTISTEPARQSRRG